MAAPNSGPTSRKFTNDDVLRCFDEENRRHVGKIELSSAEITEILNSRVLDDEQVTRQAVKNRLDEMEGEQLVKNEHGRSHLYTRRNDLDRLFREPEPVTSPAPGGGGGRREDTGKEEEFDVKPPAEWGSSKLKRLGKQTEYGGVSVVALAGVLAAASSLPTGITAALGPAPAILTPAIYIMALFFGVLFLVVGRGIRILGEVIPSKMLSDAIATERENA